MILLSTPLFSHWSIPLNHVVFLFIVTFVNLKVQIGAAFLPRNDEDLQPSFQRLTQSLDHQAVETRYGSQLLLGSPRTLITRLWRPGMVPSYC